MPAANVDAAAGIARNDARCRMHIDAAAELRMSAVQTHSVRRHSAVDLHVVFDVDETLDVDEAIGLQTQIRVRSEDIDVAAHDDVTVGVECEQRVIRERCQCARQQERVLSLSEQRMIRIRRADLSEVSAMIEARRARTERHAV